MSAPSRMKKFVKSLLTRPFGRRPATIRNNRIRLGCEVFEDRTVPAVVATDLSDYAFGSTAYITGDGFAANETVTLQVLHADGTPGSNDDPQNQSWTVTADASGAITSYWVVDDPDAVGSTYTLTALGVISGETANTTFTDSPKVGSVSVGPQTGTVNQGTPGSVTYSVTVNRGTGGSSTGAFTANFSVTAGLPAGATVSGSVSLAAGNPQQTSNTGTMTITTTSATPAGTYTITVRATRSDQSTDFAEATATFTVGAPTSVAPSVTTNPTNQSITYGDNATFTAAASGTPAPAAQWQVNSGSGWTDISGATSTTLTLMTPTVAMSGNQYRAVFTNTAGSTPTTAATLTVAKATPTATLAVTNSPQTYTGSGQAATVGTVASSVPGSVANVLTGGSATQTNVGTYLVTANFVPDDTTNYNTLTGLSAGTFDITPANATVTYSGYAGGTYDGAAHTRTVTVTGVGGSSDVLFTDSLSGTNAGSYSQAWSFSNPNYNPLSGTLSFTIDKADATVVVSGYTGGTYDGAEHTRTVTVTGVGGSSDVLFTDSLSGTNAGSYSKAWSFSGSPNYNDESGTLAFTIAKANATVSVVNHSGTYDGQSHTASVTITGVGGETLATNSVSRTNAGSDSATASISDLQNYNDVSGTATIDIAKAQLTVTADPKSKFYGDPDPVLTYSITAGILYGSDALSGDLSRDTGENVGTYSINQGTLTAGDNYDLMFVGANLTITARSLDDYASAVTQSALNVNKNGTVTIALTVDSNGIVDGQSVADLFNGAKFKISMSGETLVVYSTATVVDNVVYVTLDMKDTAVYNFLLQGVESGETSASKADWETLFVTAKSNDGNYSLSDSVLSRIFKTK